MRMLMWMYGHKRLDKIRNKHVEKKVKVTLI